MRETKQNDPNQTKPNQTKQRKRHKNSSMWFGLFAVDPQIARCRRKANRNTVMFRSEFDLSKKEERLKKKTKKKTKKVERVANLASQSGGFCESEREVEHVFFLVGSGRKFLKNLRFQNDVTRGAGTRSVTCALQVDTELVGHFQHVFPHKIPTNLFRLFSVLRKVHTQRTTREQAAKKQTHPTKNKNPLREKQNFLFTIIHLM